LFTELKTQYTREYLQNPLIFRALVLSERKRD
jgi:hypothetical protein